MNILTINLLFSTFVFWIAARIYVLPRLPELSPRTVLLPILLLHSFRHLGLMFLAPGGHLSRHSAAVCLSGCVRRSPGCSVGSGLDCRSGEGFQREPISGLDFQRGRHGGSSFGDNTGHNLWSPTAHGPSLLDPRVLGPCAVGDALHHVCSSDQVLERSSLIPQRRHYLTDRISLRPSVASASACPFSCLGIHFRRQPGCSPRNQRILIISSRKRFESRVCIWPLT